MPNQNEQVKLSTDVVQNTTAAQITKEIERVNVTLAVVWHGAAGKFDSRMSEISLESCFIDSMGQEVLGETINFKVHLPEGPWITLAGEIIYREYPIGFEARFINLTGENRKLLLQLIAAHGGKQARQILSEQLAKAPAPITSKEKPRVLVADDDTMTLRMMTVIAETQGYEVVAAADGLEAFKILQQDAAFSAAIFDMMMPHLRGLELIRLMKTDARLSRIPIGMITAEQDPKIWDESVAAGASVFLPKPFSPPQIQMMLLMLLNQGSRKNV